MMADVKITLTDHMADFESFSIALDESTDLSYIAQLTIFIGGVDKEYNFTKELLALQPLKEITTGEDIFIEVQKTTNVDTRVYLGVKIGTDYFLMVCRMKASVCQRWRHHAKTAGYALEYELERIKFDDDGYLLNEENNVKERWKNYFKSVFACNDDVANVNSTATEYVIDDGNESEITMDQIMKALKGMKVGKAAGYDRVSSETQRGGGGTIASLLYQLFNKC
ncbi:General transcription factor II-I repeat domain-containing protein 2B [Eumeta japonica]|uniref:General transcription factor II-I repeat domain-containing protein 2B n=1 Tax=Eumeta variegata TaxID=151549 RepID=A0A4C1Y2Z8_EUMVA|nr:General transcription factor II-I repeat domain-containing protein 2B [Eumeta japonica]